MNLIWLFAFWAVGVIAGWEFQDLLRERNGRTAMTEVRAPEVCQACDGDGVLLRYVLDGILLSPRQADMVSSLVPSMGRRMRVHRDPCFACRCVICGARTDVIAGECGQCTDEADRYFERVSDR